MAERREIEIVRLGAQGDGAADTPDGVVFVPRALPGERVAIELTGERGRLVEVIVASASRAVPPCPHFGACGGCVAQHMSGTLYRGWKRDMVRTAFAHRGLEPAIDEVMSMPPGTRRRATFTALRRGGDVTFGFHEEGSHALVDIGTCAVVVPAIEKALPALRTIAGALLAEKETARLVVTAATEGLDVAIVEGAPQRIDAAVQARVAQMATAAGIGRVTAAGNIVMQSAAPRLVLGGASVVLPPAAFIQATAEAETAIASILLDAVGRKAKRIADLFCGLGTFTFGLARHSRVLAIDGDKAAIEALGNAAKATPGIRPVETRVRDLMAEPLSRTELADFDAVVLDPPRAGAKAQAEMLARAKVPVICAVSCNPATLARDCRILVDAGYTIDRVVPVDQFVWSPHVEVVAVLRRGR